MLALAYNDSDKVLKAFEEFRSSVIYKNEKESNLVISNLLTLLKEMANKLHIKYNFSNDDLFTGDNGDRDSGTFIGYVA